MQIGLNSGHELVNTLGVVVINTHPSSPVGPLKANRKKVNVMDESAHVKNYAIEVQ